MACFQIMPYQKVSVQLQSQSVHPLLHRGFIGAGAKSHAFLPVPGSGHIRQKLSALAKSRGCGSCKGDDGLACEVIVFNKLIYRPGSFSPPDRIVNRRLSPLTLNFTRINDIQECVLCHLNSAKNIIPF